jgi:hypothetical protein
LRAWRRLIIEESLKLFRGGDHYSVIFDDDVAESIQKFTDVLGA